MNAGESLTIVIDGLKQSVHILKYSRFGSISFWLNCHWSVAFHNPERPQDARIAKESCGYS